MSKFGISVYAVKIAWIDENADFKVEVIEQSFERSQNQI